MMTRQEKPFDIDAAHDAHLNRMHYLMYGDWLFDPAADRDDDETDADDDGKSNE